MKRSSSTPVAASISWQDYTVQPLPPRVRDGGPECHWRENLLAAVGGACISIDGNACFTAPAGAGLRWVAAPSGVVSGNAFADPAHISQGFKRQEQILRLDVTPE